MEWESLEISGTCFYRLDVLLSADQQCWSTERNTNHRLHPAALPHPFFIHYWNSDRRGIASFILALQWQYPTVINNINTHIHAHIHRHWTELFCRTWQQLAGSDEILNKFSVLFHEQVSAAADGPTWLAVSRSLCCTQRWTLSLIN